MITALVLVPLLGGIAAFAAPWERPQRWFLVGVAAAHFAIVVAALASPPGPVLGGWLAADSLGLLMLTITSALFLAASAYAVAYLGHETARPRTDWIEGGLFSNQPQRMFTGCLLLFLAAMTTVTLSQHLGLLWISVEATTLTSAPLVYFHRHHRSLEATWKYLLVGSVGIALALLGTFFVGIAATTGPENATRLVVGDLIASAGTLNHAWLEAGFIFILVGYGTKMGLAPLHTWLPDAHSESPSLVSALMSGALLNCAFVAVLRFFEVLNAAGLAHFAQQLLIAFGVFSMAVAALFILLQTDYKRMLAYSSVEHIGILALGIGVGGGATTGAVFHALNHSLAKALLFLVAGNILFYYRTTSIRGVRGLLTMAPATAVLWLAGFLAITGMPPFGTFFSEFMILESMIAQGYAAVAGVYLALLVVIFAAMATVVLHMTYGESWGTSITPPRESLLSVAPPAVLAVCALGVGLYLPSTLHSLIAGAAALLGGS